jgi:predicted kinase
VSLDHIRDELDVDPADAQGTVVAHARELAREHLRAGRRFVWNATNVSRQLRASVVNLFLDYGARVRMVYVEVPERELRAQNRAREAVVPGPVMDRLLDRWEVPELGRRTRSHTSSETGRGHPVVDDEREWKLALSPRHTSEAPAGG